MSGSASPVALRLRKGVRFGILWNPRYCFVPIANVSFASDGGIIIAPAVVPGALCDVLPQVVLEDRTKKFLINKEVYCSSATGGRSREIPVEELHW